MKTITRRFFLVSCLMLLVWFPTTVIGGAKAAQKEQELFVGTGITSGVYHPAGEAICDLVNQSQEQPRVQCTHLDTKGSIHNLEKLYEGRLHLAIAQSDTVYRAWLGQSPFMAIFSNLRVLFTLHQEMISLVVHKDSGIDSLKKIKGKRVNIGRRGSGNERVVYELLFACKIPPSSLETIGRLTTNDMPGALRKRELDGYFFMAGHPNDNIKEVISSSPVNILPLTGGCIDRLVKHRPYFYKTSIPGDVYATMKKDVPTFGVKAFVVSSKDVDEDAIYRVVKSVFENLDVLRKRHPTFQKLTSKNMLLKGSTVLYHRGAIKYFRERGWHK